MQLTNPVEQRLNENEVAAVAAAAGVSPEFVSHSMYVEQDGASSDYNMLLTRAQKAIEPARLALEEVLSCSSTPIAPCQIEALENGTAHAFKVAAPNDYHITDPKSWLVEFEDLNKPGTVYKVPLSTFLGDEFLKSYFGEQFAGVNAARLEELYWKKCDQEIAKHSGEQAVSIPADNSIKGDSRAYREGKVATPASLSSLTATDGFKSIRDKRFGRLEEQITNSDRVGRKYEEYDFPLSAICDYISKAYPVKREGVYLSMKHIDDNINYYKENINHFK